MATAMVTVTDMAMVTDNLKNEDKNRCKSIGFCYLWV